MLVTSTAPSWVTKASPTWHTLEKAAFAVSTSRAMNRKEFCGSTNPLGRACAGIGWAGTGCDGIGDCSATDLCLDNRTGSVARRGVLPSKSHLQIDMRPPVPPGDPPAIESGKQMNVEPARAGWAVATGSARGAPLVQRP